MRLDFRNKFRLSSTQKLTINKMIAHWRRIAKMCKPVRGPLFRPKSAFHLNKSHKILVHCQIVLYSVLFDKFKLVHLGLSRPGEHHLQALLSACPGWGQRVEGKFPNPITTSGQFSHLFSIFIFILHACPLTSVAEPVLFWPAPAPCTFFSPAPAPFHVKIG